MKGPWASELVEEPQEGRSLSDGWDDVNTEPEVPESYNFLITEAATGHYFGEGPNGACIVESASEATHFAVAEEAEAARICLEQNMPGSIWVLAAIDA